MSQIVVPMGLNTLRNTLTMTTSPQDVFTYQMLSGRMIISIVFGTIIGNVDFSIMNGEVLCLNSYGLFDNGCGGLRLPFALNYTIGNFSLYFTYASNKLQVNVLEGNATPTLVFSGLLISSSGYIGPNAYAADSLTVATSGSSLAINSGITMNSGIINIGTDASSNYAINIGTAASGSRLVTLGNTVSGSKIVLGGRIDTPDPTVGTITFNNNSAITWENVSSTAKQIGNITYVSIKCTLTPSLTVNTNTKYSFFTLTPSSFDNPNVITADVLIEGESLIKGTLISTPGSGVYQIIVPSLLTVDGGAQTISCSFTYII